jgi:hypothetical protein
MVESTSTDVCGILAALVDMECDMIVERGEPREVIDVIEGLLKLPYQESLNKRYALLVLIGRMPSMNDSHIIENDSDEESFKCETPSHPLYTPALYALKENANPKPIAKLLKNKVPMPDWVGLELGIMLDKSDGYRGYRLILKTNNGKQWRDLLPTVREKRDVGNRFREMISAGEKYEHVVKKLMDDTGKSRTWIKSTQQVDNYYLVQAVEAWLGHIDDDITH